MASRSRRPKRSRDCLVGGCPVNISAQRPTGSCILILQLSTTALLSLGTYRIDILVREGATTKAPESNRYPLSARVACKEAESGRKTHDGEDQREDEAEATSGVICPIAEVNFDGRSERGARGRGRELCRAPLEPVAKSRERGSKRSVR